MRRSSLLAVVVVPLIGCSAALVGCKNEVPDRDAPGGIVSGSDYARLRARNVGLMDDSLEHGKPRKPSETAGAMPTTHPAGSTAPMGSAPAAAAAPSAPAAPAAPVAPGAEPAPIAPSVPAAPAAPAPQ